MKVHVLQVAVDEAKRFIRKALECSIDEDACVEPGSQRAAIKRASLDLTKALANIRKRNS